MNKMTLVPGVTICVGKSKTRSEIDSPTPCSTIQAMNPENSSNDERQQTPELSSEQILDKNNAGNDGTIKGNPKNVKNLVSLSFSHPVTIETNNDDTVSFSSNAVTDESGSTSKQTSVSSAMIPDNTSNTSSTVAQSLVKSKVNHVGNLKESDSSSGANIKSYTPLLLGPSRISSINPSTSSTSGVTTTISSLSLSDDKNLSSSEKKSINSIHSKQLVERRDFSISKAWIHLPGGKRNVKILDICGIYLDKCRHPNDLCDLQFLEHNELMFGGAGLIQSQTFESLSNPRKAQSTPNPIFNNHFTNLSVDFGGHVLPNEIPTKVLEQESGKDSKLRRALQSGSVSTIDTILKFISYIKARLKLPLEVFIIALVYMNRLSTTMNMAITNHNWRSLWVSCCILAEKLYNDDHSIDMEFIACVVPITPKLLCLWEIETLKLLEYRLIIKPSVFGKFIFELRNLFAEVLGKEPVKKHAEKFEHIRYEENFRLGHFSKDDSFIPNIISNDLHQKSLQQLKKEKHIRNN